MIRVQGLGITIPKPTCKGPHRLLHLYIVDYLGSHVSLRKAECRDEKHFNVAAAPPASIAGNG